MPNNGARLFSAKKIKKPNGNDIEAPSKKEAYLKEE